MPFRRERCLAILVVPLVVGAGANAAGDEIRRWRDEGGQLHVRIIGSGDPVDPDEAGMPLLSTSDPSPDEQFSIDSSRRRREIERRLRSLSAELRSIHQELAETEAREFVVYAPGVAEPGQDPQLVIDAQRNAFLTARKFERDKTDDLRIQRRKRRDRLVALREVWSDFESLRQQVRERYGEPPPWWRDRLDCEGCLSAREVESQLRAKSAPRSATGREKPGAPDG